MSHDVSNTTNTTHHQVTTEQQVPGASNVDYEKVNAILYCEGSFGCDKNTRANGVMRTSRAFNVHAVIDSDKAYMDAGQVLDGTASGIPICRDLNHAMRRTHNTASHFIFGVEKGNGELTAKDRYALFQAMEKGLHIVSDMQAQLSGEECVVRKAESCGVTLVQFPGVHC